MFKPAFLVFATCLHLAFLDELVVFCPLTPFQEDVYQTLLQNPDVELIRKKNFPCDCGSGMDRGKCCYIVSYTGVNRNKSCSGVIIADIVTW